MPFLVDSNIIIYSFSSEFEYLRELLINEECVASEISRLEVMGYYNLTQEQQQYFSDIFSYMPIIHPDKEIFDSAVEIRRKYKLKLADSLIAATAKVHGLSIYTRNTNDFNMIKGVKCINPIK